MKTDKSVKVAIYGTDYRVSGAADEDYIRGIADYVDHTMRDISRQGRHISPVRIAVLAAFNIADELFQLRGDNPSEVEMGDNEEKAERLLKLFEEIED